MEYCKVKGHSQHLSWGWPYSLNIRSLVLEKFLGDSPLIYTDLYQIKKRVVNFDFYWNFNAKSLIQL